MMEEKDMPLVSVVVPCYNHEKYVTETIESIVNQTYKNIELIVIDDGSNDSSVEVIQELVDKYGFTFIHRPNKGLSATLNEGIGLSKGKYFSAIASDDYWALSKIEKQVKMMEVDKNIVMSFTEFKEVDENNNINGKGKYSNRNNPIYNFENVLMYADLPPASLLMRLEQLQKIGGFSEELRVEDLHVWLNLLKDGGYAKIVPEPLAYYRIHDNNTHSNDLMITREHFRTVNMFLDKHKEFRKNILNEWALRNANILARNHKKESLSYFKYLSSSSFLNIRLYKIIYKLMFR